MGRRGSPYVPSYMHNLPSPELCVVCGDTATGYHYRRMTCEGCKGFFRRTTQKNLKYICRENGACIIDKSTRNQCPECRYKKCCAVGMACDLVLSDSQRAAKRQLIEQNRKKRKIDAMRQKIYQDIADSKESDQMLLLQLMTAYRSALSVSSQMIPLTYTSRFLTMSGQPYNPSYLLGRGPVFQVADITTPAVSKLITFSHQVPGFRALVPADQTVLLKGACLEIMILRVTTRFSPAYNSIIINEKLFINESALSYCTGRVQTFLKSVLKLAAGLARLQVDDIELAVLATLSLATSRPGLTDSTEVDILEETLLSLLRRYETLKYPAEPERFGKLIVKLMELRMICLQDSETILQLKLDGSSEIPPFLFETLFCH